MNVQTPSNALVEAKPIQRAIRVVTDPIPVLDTARFEHMQRIANVMAHSNLVPDALCKTKDGDRMVALEPEEIISNCFLVVNQAVRWGMDPFAVAQCVSVVHNKLCYEGKLISAIIDAKLGIRLKFEWDEKPGDSLGITVIGKFDDEDEPRTVKGTVADWKTTGAGSPWTPKQSRKMLAYRGAREWARLHCPSLMLGVYSDDELENLSHEVRGNNARVVAEQDDGPPEPPAARAIEHQPSPPIDGQVVWAEEGERPATAQDFAEPDDGSIPAGLRREAKPSATVADIFDPAQWLRDLEGAFSGCEDYVSLGEKQKSLMLPHKGKAFPVDWGKAVKLFNANMSRIGTSVMGAG